MEELPELLAPAGDWDCIRAAVANGADAVYFGLSKFNARMRATNFDDLPAVVDFLHSRGVKAYVTFNVLVFTDEFPAAIEVLQQLEAAGVDAVIIQDVGLADVARRVVPRLRVHASTQMTITSPEGVEFAVELGVKQVVLARELSIRELRKFTPDQVPLEVFVHGALCVAYSGQCLTSESLGQRSANRGECAQACRMPYELLVDAQLRDLGDRRYLLSPQDLAAVGQIGELVKLGIRSFKIEGRLKTPEYVAAVTSVYRRALDAAIAERQFQPTKDDWYKLEMTFSRGLFPGWMHGVNHQELVPARFGKKRGPLVGRVVRTGRDWIETDGTLPVASGDGLVFDNGGDTNDEDGGRVVRVQGGRIFFDRTRTRLERVVRGTLVWKTDDPALARELRTTFAGRIAARRREPLELVVEGMAGNPLRLLARSGNRTASAETSRPLEVAIKQPLTTERLLAQLGKLEETPFRLSSLENRLDGDVILPLSELNRLRRQVIHQLMIPAAAPREAATLEELEREIRDRPRSTDASCELAVLCRTLEQLDAVVDAGIQTIYVDFEDIRRYREAVERVRRHPDSPAVFLATPRIQKAGEQGFFKLIENADPDGVLIRNVGAIHHFRDSSLRLMGDFSLNVANPFSARLFIDRGLEGVTVSYDLAIDQVVSLLQAAPPHWFELTIHQHMPLFHMEHCVFAAFLSDGTDHTNCGRPCDRHRVHLRDRVGVEHPVLADVGCRNTVFNAKAQTGARFFSQLRATGLSRFRLELLEETPAEALEIISAYRDLLAGQVRGESLWKSLRANPQLGVTQGTY